MELQQITVVMVGRNWVTTNNSRVTEGHNVSVVTRWISGVMVGSTKITVGSEPITRMHSHLLSRPMGLGGISSAWHWPAQVSTHETTLHRSIAMLPRISSQSTDAGHLLTPQYMSYM